MLTLAHGSAGDDSLVHAWRNEEATNELRLSSLDAWFSTAVSEDARTSYEAESDYSQSLVPD